MAIENGYNSINNEEKRFRDNLGEHVDRVRKDFCSDAKVGCPFVLASVLPHWHREIKEVYPRTRYQPHQRDLDRVRLISYSKTAFQ